MGVGRQRRWFGPAALAAVLGASLAGGPTEAAPHSPGYCDVTNASQAAPVLSAVQASGMYVDQTCEPSLGWMAQPGGAWGSAQFGVVSAGRERYDLAYSGGKTTLIASEVTGKVLWRQRLPVAGTLTGDGHILVVAPGSPDEIEIINPTTRHITTVTDPYTAQYQRDGDYGVTNVTVLGGLAIITTNLNMGRGGASETVSSLVQVYDAAGKRLRHFTVADRPNGSDYQGIQYMPFDKTWVQTVGNAAYILFSDGGDGSEAGIYRLTTADVLTGPFKVPVSVTDPELGSFLAFQGGYLLLSRPIPGSAYTQAGPQSDAALYRYANGRLQTVWRKAINGAEPVADGRNIVTSGVFPASDLTEIDLVDWRTGTTRMRASTQVASGTVLAAGPFGILLWGQAGWIRQANCETACLQVPSIVSLYANDGDLGWSRQLPSDNVAPEFIDLGGRPVLALGPGNLAVLW